MGAPKKLLFLLLLSPLALYARPGSVCGKVEGVLNGYVMDAITKKPLSGVVVSAFVPGSNSTKEVTTDADGYFRFAELPASPVTIEFNKRGYQSCRRPNIVINKEKAPVKLNIEFVPEDGDSDPDNADSPMIRLLEVS
jgi:hypothetical protein